MIVGLLVLLCSLSDAETVYLKNGNEMQGAVKSETDTEVVLDIPYGSVSLKKSDILRIKYPTDSDAASGISSQEAREFALGKHVPDDADAIDAGLRDLRRLRETARDARGQQQSRQESLDSAKGDLSGLREQFGDEARSMGNAQVQEQRAIAGEMNRIAGRALSVRLNARAALEDLRKAQAALFEYMNAYEDLRQKAADPELRKAMQAAQGWDRKYYSWFDAQLADMKGDFKQDSVKTEAGMGGHLVVTTLINGRVPARLLLDTGATMTALSQKVADALRLDSKAQAGKMQMHVADGRTMETPVYILESMQVGDSEVEHVAAGVIPSGPPGVDGLLGMSFLNHFVIQVDSANKRLTLKSLR
jgi:clan AA aspartic protease (TIGR02281 family)